MKGIISQPGTQEIITTLCCALKKDQAQERVHMDITADFLRVLDWISLLVEAKELLRIIEVDAQ